MLPNHLRLPVEMLAQTQITQPGVKVVDLPGGPINHHWTKNVIASQDGTRLHVTVGSNSNVGENGMEHEIHRAAILEIDPATGHSRVFASGLRNPNGLAWQPQSGALWTTVNERDEIGSDLVPDYMTSVKDGAFYGWPYSYYGQHVDTRVQPPRPDLVAKAIAPDYALSAHRFARAYFLSREFIAKALFWRRVHRPAWLLESSTAQRLQSNFCSLRQRAARGVARRYPYRLRQ